MNTIEQVTPGIRLIFERLGYGVAVLQDAGIKVNLTKDGDVQTRTFPTPTTNSDLSTALLAWRDELAGEGG